MELQQELKNQAVSLGLCQQWQSEWGTPNNDELIQKYVKGIDFAIKHDFPSVEFINKSFDKAALHRNGVFCDDEINGKNRVMVLLGGSSGEIDLNGYDVATIYVRHYCKVRITVADFASVIIKVYDSAEVSIDTKGFNKPRIYRYSDKASIFTNGEVVIKERDFSEIYGD